MRVIQGTNGNQGTLGNLGFDWGTMAAFLPVGLDMVTGKAGANTWNSYLAQRDAAQRAADSSRLIRTVLLAGAGVGAAVLLAVALKAKG